MAPMVCPPIWVFTFLNIRNEQFPFDEKKKMLEKITLFKTEENNPLIDDFYRSLIIKI